MTDEEIKKLAESYIDELFADDDMSDQDNIEDKNDALVMCMAFVGHILETHCIVPKSKVQLEYKKSYSASFDNTTCLDRQYARGRYQVLRAIFGREIFREDNK